MIRIAVLAAIWLIAGTPLLVRAVGGRSRRRREDVGDVLARVVAGPDPSPTRDATRRSGAPGWPLFLLSFVATAGAAAGSTPIAAGAVVALNLLTIALGHRARSRVVRAALRGRR
jgi:hypothetical protein